MFTRILPVLCLLAIGCKKAAYQVGKVVGDISHEAAKGVMDAPSKDIDETMEKIKKQNAEAMEQFRIRQRQEADRRENEAILKASVPNGPRKR